MRRTRLISLFVAVIAFVFFFAPIALRGAGVREHCCVENRPFSPAPRLAEGWNAFDQATRYLIDRMPGRQRAVRANTWISQNLFDTTPVYGRNGPGGVAADQALPFSGRPEQDRPATTATTAGTPAPVARPAGSGPTPQQALAVVPGKQGWLFLQYAFDSACHPRIPVDSAVSVWTALLGVIRASGRKVVLAVPPDKSTIYPELVKSDTPNLACSRRADPRFWKALSSAAARQAGILTLRNAEVGLKAHTRGLTYLPKDSHWNGIGSLALPEAVVPAFDRHLSVKPGEIVDPGAGSSVGDLTKLLGTPQSEPVPSRTIRRARGAKVIPGPALLLGDSYAKSPYPQMKPYFANLRYTQWDSNTAQQLATAISRAHTVVLESVQRELVDRAANGGVATAVLAAVTGRLTPVH